MQITGGMGQSADLMGYALERSILDQMEKESDPLKRLVREQSYKRMDAGTALGALKNNKFKSALKKNIRATVLITEKHALEKPLEAYADNEPIKLRTLPLDQLVFIIEGREYRYSDALFKTSPYEPLNICTGTGFFVREDIVVSAAHNMITEEHYVIKGWYSTGARPPVITKKNIFKITKVYSEEAGYTDTPEAAQEDWVFFRVEPCVKGNKHTDWVVPSTKPLTLGMDTYCLGHCFGLPTLVSWNGTVYKAKDGHNSFFAKLETYFGKSGGPVFDAVTHQIVGVLSGQVGVRVITDGVKVSHHVLLAGDYGARISHFYRVETQLKNTLSF